MLGPWRNAQPLPEAVAPPIFPDHDTPRLARVSSPYLKKYRPLTDPEARANPEIGKVSERAVDLYINERKLHPIYPVGTLIPVRISGWDLLIVIQWHNNLNPAGHPGIEMWTPLSMFHVDLLLLGRWRVTFDTGWSWFYSFYGTQAAFYTDIKDRPEESGHGTWTVSDGSIKIVWQTSSEEWFLPMNTGGMRGQSRVGQGGLSAEKVW
jgi:hypothetical protein